MTLRERIALAIYKRLNCAVPFADQGEMTRAECYADADAALDELTKPPTDAMAIAGRITLCDGNHLHQDATGFYRNMAVSVFENMVRAGIEEKTPEAPVEVPWVQCELHCGLSGARCGNHKGHEGICEPEIPF